MESTLTPRLLRAKRLLLTAVVTSIVFFGAVCTADAQGSCTASTGGVFGVVPPCWSGNAAVELSAAPRFGDYDGGGRFVRADGAPATDLVVRAGGGVRMPLDELQIYGRIPAGMQIRLGEETSGVGAGVGDVEVGGQYTLVRDPGTGPTAGLVQTFIPFVDLMVEVAIPTGSWPGRSADEKPLFGDGTWAVDGGVRVAKFITYRDVVRIFSTISVPVARVDNQSTSGLGGGAGFGYRRVQSMLWSWGIDVELTTARQSGAAAATDVSHTIGVELSGRVEYVVDYPHWIAVAEVSTDWFGPVGGVAHSGIGPALSVGLQRSF